MGSESLVKRVHVAEIKGRRGKGLPRKEWNANFKQ